MNQEMAADPRVRARVIGSRDAAQLLNFSLNHFRRLAAAGKVPKPIRISERKLGWRVGDLLDFIQSREAA